MFVFFQSQHIGLITSQEAYAGCADFLVCSNGCRFWAAVVALAIIAFDYVFNIYF